MSDATPPQIDDDVGIDWRHRGTLELRDLELFDRWLPVSGLLSDTTLLAFSASGRWFPAPDWALQCGPDGLAGPRIDASELLLPEIPIGCLIGRIGGGTAGLNGPALLSGSAVLTTPGADGKPFAIGRSCVLPMPRQLFGPIYVALNTVQRPVRILSLKVDVWSGLAPVVAPAPETRSSAK